MRNLPSNDESKEAVLTELEHHRIEASDESKINDAKERKAICISLLREAIIEFTETWKKKKAQIEDAKLKHRCSKHVLGILSTHVAKLNYADKDIEFNSNDSRKHEIAVQLLKINEHAEIIERISKCLSLVGLKLPCFNMRWDYEFTGA